MIRSATKQDKNKILDLFEKVFHNRMSDEEYEWKYYENPNPRNPLVLVYEEDDQILGHVALWVNDAFINGEIHNVGLRVDTMVDPDARGKGIYRKLLDELLEVAEDKDIAILYGYPAEKAKELFIRYTGAVHLTDVPRLLLLQKPVELLSRNKPFLKAFTFIDKLFQAVQMKKTDYQPSSIEEIKKCDARFDQLQLDNKDQYPVKLKRGMNYLNWRYLNHPFRDYKILAHVEDNQLKGYIVYRVIEQSNQGMIIDMDVHDWQDREVVQNLIAAAVDRMKGTAAIQAWALEPSALYQSLKNHKFLHKDNPMPMVVRDIKELAIDSSTTHSWYVTNGDVDSF
ncbi:GNAT family N-acetyltransferase [Gracilibacillus caseinilyticus]|uniref:GNAT family N-acetyltransferase n=1 Tax=Gracilibacillus caseinilyticus TaxID=2932256 RepID=A0ABY4F0U3_9BACI|nr:GNAT family N-acetyltransferase [Gracilibacillus caseinilyticus]UOQ50286.1 GNAT family N-acetyltransferase [Gracilibacillus caseinilyticus]